LTQHENYDIVNLSYFLGVIVVTETTNLSIRIEKALKEEADQLFNALGLSLTTAINVFVRQAVMQRKIPFELTLGEEETPKNAERKTNL
jgi:addiction module RelB/DinJ family antitoxin